MDELYGIFIYTAGGSGLRTEPLDHLRVVGKKCIYLLLDR